MRKADFAAVIIALCLCCAASVFVSGGDCVAIYVDGELYRTLPLATDASVTIKTDYGENTISVKNGTVSVTESDCPNGQCMSGKIERCGQSIVCLPHRLSVIIESDRKKNETDVIL